MHFDPSASLVISECQTDLGRNPLTVSYLHISFACDNPQKSPGQYSGIDLYEPSQTKRDTENVRGGLFDVCEPSGRS